MVAIHIALFLAMFGVITMASPGWFIVFMLTVITGYCVIGGWIAAKSED
jgi:hypothetical protein